MKPTALVFPSVTLALGLVLAFPLPADARQPATPTWAFENSDIAVDPAYRFGKLENGMRYVIRHNERPAGTVLIRMIVRAGSLDEKRSELGYAHFVEHMAFNGSTRIAEGEMIRLLERHGLAFGADTNASTGFETTTYKLDLPGNDAERIEVALMLMRETASELTISQGAVERERGVILSEMRDRNTFSYRDTLDNTQFFYPRARFARRFPIGTVETLSKANAQRLRTFYEREYVPSHTTLIVVGDVDPAEIEVAIAAQFGNWQARKARTQPSAGPIQPGDKARTDIYVDPSLPERTVISRSGPWLDEPDTVANRRENLLREIGYGIVNRRLERLSRREDPPFRGAGFGTGDVFRAARSTRLIVDTVDRKWRRGLTAAAQEYRRALAYGFTKEEVAEQVANLRSSLENAAAAADTRSNAALVNAATSLVNDELVPSHPANALARFLAFAPEITPDTTLVAMKREALSLDEPLIRFRGRFDPAGGAQGIRAAWRESMRIEVAQESPAGIASFAYTDFGPAGLVASDVREPALGIREVVFTNGVQLNLKRTELEKDRVRLAMSIDGGNRLDTMENPLATEMMGFLDEGGLGKHSRDELQSILAGRTVSDGFGTGETSFDARATTTPRDLELQLQLWAAFVTDPGYRREGEVQYRHQMNNYFAQLRATPSSALRAELGAIISANDPRFSLHEVAEYRALNYDRLRAAISGRLERGAMEIGVVGDIDEDHVIALVASTFGALPSRETAFHSLSDMVPRRFNPDRSPRVIRHVGPADQALLRLNWPTRDDADPVEALTLELLERIARIELTDDLREALGKAYSPGASSALSRHWTGYGTFSIQASVDVRDVPQTRSAMIAMIDRLRTQPVSDDVLRRARQPMLEAIQNGLKTNSGWLSLVDRAQTEPDRIQRHLAAGERLAGLTAADVLRAAQRYLDPKAGLEILVLPEGVNPPPAPSQASTQTPPKSPP